MNSPNLFEYPPEVADSGSYVRGFEVLAVDGTIGTVEAATYDHGRSCLVVDTDHWMAGARRLLPAGTVRGVSRDARRLFIGLTKDEIRRAPDYDERKHHIDERTYLETVADYYEPWAPLRSRQPALGGRLGGVPTDRRTWPPSRPAGLASDRSDLRFRGRIAMSEAGRTLGR
jgi:hypothetical protein